MPAAVYRTLRSRTARNPNPLTFGRGFAFQSSTPFKDFLLCDGCETRLRENGEDWVLANCLLPGGCFPLLGTLRNAQPEWHDNDIRIYSCARIPEINSDSLIYFAASVFWRAGAHTWRMGCRSVHIDLGRYEEDLRTYLLGLVPFPGNAAIEMVLLERASEYAINPLSRNDQGHHEHQFTIPGLSFILYLGGRIPQEAMTLNLAPSPQRYAFIYPRAEDMQIARLARLYQEERRRQMRERQ
jgi:hypothetical protein